MPGDATYFAPGLTRKTSPWSDIVGQEVKDGTLLSSTEYAHMGFPCKIQCTNTRYGGINKIETSFYTTTLSRGLITTGKFCCATHKIGNTELTFFPRDVRVNTGAPYFINLETGAQIQVGDCTFWTCCLWENYNVKTRQEIDIQTQIEGLDRHIRNTQNRIALGDDYNSFVSADIMSARMDEIAKASLLIRSATMMDTGLRAADLYYPRETHPEETFTISPGVNHLKEEMSKIKKLPQVLECYLSKRKQDRNTGYRSGICVVIDKREHTIPVGKEKLNVTYPGFSLEWNMGTGEIDIVDITIKDRELGPQWCSAGVSSLCFLTPSVLLLSGSEVAYANATMNKKTIFTMGNRTNDYLKFIHKWQYEAALKLLLSIIDRYTPKMPGASLIREWATPPNKAEEATHVGNQR